MNPTTPNLWKYWDKIALAASIFIVPFGAGLALIFHTVEDLFNSIGQYSAGQILWLTTPVIPIGSIILLGGLLWLHIKGLRLYGFNWWHIFKKISIFSDELLMSTEHRLYFYGGIWGGALFGIIWGLSHPYGDRFWLVNFIVILFYLFVGMLPGLAVGMFFDPTWRPGAIIGAIESIIIWTVFGIFIGLSGVAWIQYLFSAIVFGLLFGAAMMPFVEVLWAKYDPVSGESIERYLNN